MRCQNLGVPNECVTLLRILSVKFISRAKRVLFALKSNVSVLFRRTKNVKNRILITLNAVTSMAKGLECSSFSFPHFFSNY